MIPRYQTVLFLVLLAASAIMGVVLWQLRDRDHQRLLQVENSLPIQPSSAAPEQPATLYVANDAVNSVAAEVLTLPLPENPGQRARAILGKLLDLYAASGSTHPVSGGAASVAQVFLLPVTSRDSGLTRAGATPSAGTAPSTVNGPQAGPELAVVNLTSSFAANHPSGLEAETLTILSICATLHANLPRVTEVRFLVDGQPRPTLAGHADLMRTYLTGEPVSTAGGQPETQSGAQPEAQPGSQP